MNTWIVNSNASEAKIYTANKKDKNLHLHKELSHPQSRMKGSELMADGSGRYSTFTGQGSYSPPTTPKRTEKEHFAIEISHLLENARASQAFDKLILIAPPEFNGILLKHFSRPLQLKIVKNIHKDYHKLKERELEKVL